MRLKDLAAGSAQFSNEPDWHDYESNDPTFIRAVYDEAHRRGYDCEWGRPADSPDYKVSVFCSRGQWGELLRCGHYAVYQRLTGRAA